MRRLELGLAVQHDARGLAARHLVPPVAVPRRGPVNARVAHDDARQPHARTPAPAGRCPSRASCAPHATGTEDEVVRCAVEARLQEHRAGRPAERS